MAGTLATSSIGIIRGGGDEGSGLGGTGRDGLPGSSGFGGTGGPSPFFGDAGTTEPENDDDPFGGQNLDDWPAPWLPRETETARIPDEIAPLIEIQRNPFRDPTRNLQTPENPGELRIIEDETSSLPAHLRQQMDLANTAEAFTEQPSLEIRVRIPEIEPPAPLVLSQRLVETADVTAVVTEHEALEREVQDAEEETPAAVVDTRALAENAAEQTEEIPEIITEAAEQTDPRTSTERIQRPELPPFQRLRPAVDRASVAPSARPQPMRI